MQIPTYLTKLSPVKITIITVAIITTCCVLTYFSKSIIRINDTSYTYADIRAMKSVANEIVNISGKGDKISMSQVVNNLVLGALKKEIIGKAAQVDKAAAIKNMIDPINNYYAGLLKKQYAAMGEDKFYKLFLEPLVYNSAFMQYYSSNDDNVKAAYKAIEEVKQIGLPVYAEKHKLQLKTETLQLTKDTAQAFEFIKGFGLNNPGIYESDAVNITVVKDIGLDKMNIQYVLMPRTPFNTFLESEIKKKNIVIDFSLLSLYRMSSLYKKGGILYNNK